MDIRFDTAKLEKLCNSYKDLQRKYGKQKARKIVQRLDILRAAETLAQVSHLPPLRCHELSNNRDGQFAVDTLDQNRMIFVPDHDPVPLSADGGINRSLITAIRILEVDIDYHD